MVSIRKRYQNQKKPLFRRKIGFVFQDYRLFVDKTAYENVAFALEVTGVNKKVIRQKTLSSLHMVGMTHRMNHYPHDLSGGECQRVAIARSFVHEPLIILADEPTGNLDETNSLAIIELFEKIKCSGTSVIFATHKTENVIKPGSRVIRLGKGSMTD
jgi:cell division transport system ATP-binding protein